MPSDQTAIGTFGPLTAAVAFAAIVLSAGGAGSQPLPQPVPPPTGFEYAVKFICGAAIPAKGQPDPGVVAHGVYYTAINVHNPGKEPVEFVKKFAQALPGERAGRVSRFFSASLKPDEALEIDCPDLLKLLDAGGFVKGFAVIQSKSELDVVAVYTAAPSATGTVVTLELERVPARKY
jgi:hypothetical protein